MQASFDRTTVGQSSWIFFLYGIISILFGIGAMMYPLGTAVSLAWAAGIVSLAEGVVSVFALFRKDVAVSKGWIVFYAVASLLFGAVAVSQPVQMAGVLLLMLSAWLIVAGIFRIVFAIRVRHEIEGDWLVGLSGVLAIVLGVLLFMYPIAGQLTVTIWIGAFALVYGVIEIVAGVRLHRLNRR